MDRNSFASLLERAQEVHVLASSLPGFSAYKVDIQQGTWSDGLNTSLCISVWHGAELHMAFCTMTKDFGRLHSSIDLLETELKGLQNQTSKAA